VKSTKRASGKGRKFAGFKNPGKIKAILKTSRFNGLTNGRNFFFRE